MTYEEFERDIYPRIWHLAYDAGVEAREQGLPRICNLNDKHFITPGGNILKVYRSAWEQGWDNYKIPDEFRQVESVLNNMPTRPCTVEDLE